MRIEQKHELGRAEAVRRINEFIEDLMRQELPAGVKVSGIEKNWTGDTLNFSFRVSKGFFGATITGTALVTDDLVVLEMVLPGLVTAFVPEEKIRADGQAQMARVFAGR